MVIDIVSDFSKSVQFTSVSFRRTVMGLITRIDISGELFGGESLEKVNLVDLITNGTGASESVVVVRPSVYALATALSGVRINAHSNKLPDVVHVNSS